MQTVFLIQSTNSQEVKLGPFVDSTDGVTPKNALTINASDIKIWKNGATSLANKNSGGATFISGTNGMYLAVLDSTDTDTLGSAEIHVYITGAISVRKELLIVTSPKWSDLTGYILLQNVTEGTPTQGGVSGRTIDTNSATGNIFYVTHSSSSPEPTPEEVENRTGTNFVNVSGSYGSFSVSSEGTQNVPTTTGLDANTSYFMWFMHKDQNGSRSNVIGAAFTTTQESTPQDVIFTM